ncbi:MAG: hypothetical protein EOO59_13780 [Hymenobacter sp.]|nr:MAG: hypothetical protein EOO59_13780 [Hymenobacter sp.]
MPAWPQVVRLALPGTGQSGETLPAFLALLPAPLREQQLLLAAGALALLQKAGFIAPAAATVPPAPTLAPPETQIMLGPLGAACLREILTTGRYMLFYSGFLTRLHQRRLVVPPALVVPLLHYANSHIFIPIVTDALVGERGRWLGQQNPNWQWLVGLHHSQDPATWETGLLQHRRDYII